MEKPDSASQALGSIIRIDEAQVKDHLGEIVRSTVEDTLNSLLDAEADRLCGATRYERSEARRDYRAGSYRRSLHTRAGEVQLQVPKLRKLTFETAIIERYRRRESSVEEALMEMYLAGVSGWTGFLRHLVERGLKGVQLVISDKCLGLVESAGDFLPDAHWQRCMVHFYRNVFTQVPKAKVKEVAAMLKAIHAQEGRPEALGKAELVAAKL